MGVRFVFGLGYHTIYGIYGFRVFLRRLTTGVRTGDAFRLSTVNVGVD